MSDIDTPTTGGTVPETAEAPRLSVLAQYVKDLSFENPNAPDSLAKKENANAKMDVNVDVNANRRAENVYASEIKITATAKIDDKAVFAVELLYGGVFQLDNVPAEGLEPVLLIECPRILFPFARRIIADCTRDGGYPPLLLEPIDFAGMYRAQLSAKRAKQADA